MAGGGSVIALWAAGKRGKNNPRLNCGRVSGGKGSPKNSKHSVGSQGRGNRTVSGIRV